MTILGPILMAALIVVPVLVADMDDEKTKHIAVFDQTGMFDNVFTNSKISKYTYLQNPDELAEIQRTLPQTDYFGILTLSGTHEKPNVELLSVKQPSMGIKMQIDNLLEKELEKRNLTQRGLEEAFLDSIRTRIEVNTITWVSEGEAEESSTEMIMAIGFIGALIVYMFIFMYGAQVMRGVIEEKTNRIVEIMVSSVKPFQLMMGKIIGVALVAFTQFALWIILSAIIMAVAQPLMVDDNMQNMTDQIAATGAEMPDMQEIQKNGAAKFFDVFSSVNWFQIIAAFLFYFIGGYLLYASLFAAVGAAVDNEADTQQFMLPLTVPLILAIIMAQAIIQNPDGAVAFWFSVIPFTSPVVMLIRIAFGVPTWELILSMVLLIATFIFTTWLAGKIYRTGILMYGKKVNYAELWKWIRYKN